MIKSITIRELAVHEANQLLADRRFAKLKPEICRRCGGKTGFTRRIFEITGVVNMSSSALSAGAPNCRLEGNAHSVRTPQCRALAVKN
jgi:hypothetical protein